MLAAKHSVLQDLNVERDDENGVHVCPHALPCRSRFRHYSRTRARHRTRSAGGLPRRALRPRERCTPQPVGRPLLLHMGLCAGGGGVVGPAVVVAVVLVREVGVALRVQLVRVAVHANLKQVLLCGREKQRHEPHQHHLRPGGGGGEGVRRRRARERGSVDSHLSVHAKLTQCRLCD